jgi:hypothetical protein
MLAEALADALERDPPALCVLHLPILSFGDLAQCLGHPSRATDGPVDVGAARLGVRAVANQLALDQLDAVAVQRHAVTEARRHLKPSIPERDTPVMMDAELRELGVTVKVRPGSLLEE